MAVHSQQQVQRQAYHRAVSSHGRHYWCRCCRRILGMSRRSSGGRRRTWRSRISWNLSLTSTQPNWWAPRFQVIMAAARMLSKTEMSAPCASSLVMPSQLCMPLHHERAWLSTSHNCECCVPALHSWDCSTCCGSHHPCASLSIG